MEIFWIVVSAIGAIVVLALFLGAFVLMVRMWDTLGQASEFFARENERYRRAYEQHRKQ